jgi:hypothetical protein
VGWGVADEERTVRTELCGERFQFRSGQPEFEMGIEEGQGKGAIGAAAAQPGPGGDGLDEVEVDGGKPVLIGEQGPGLVNQVVLGLPLDWVAMQVKGAPGPGSRGHDFEGVAPGNGHEETVQSMKAIGPTLPDLEAEVDLGVGEGHPRGTAGINHRSSRIA